MEEFMACNTNFNQCNAGRQYPQPISNCACQILNLLNSSGLTVVNPIVLSSSFVNAVATQIEIGQKST